MKRSLFALAIGTFALLPLALSQPASAYDYYDGYGHYGRLERDIGHDRAKLDRDYAEHRYYAEREEAGPSRRPSSERVVVQSFSAATRSARLITAATTFTAITRVSIATAIRCCVSCLASGWM